MLNSKSIFKRGDRVRFRHVDGSLVDDVVRETIFVGVLLRPYAPDTIAPALVLTNHSWCFERDVVLFNRNRPLTHYEVAAIKASDESYTVLANRYGVTKQGIGYHKLGKKKPRFKHLDEGQIAAIKASEEPVDVLASRYGVTTSAITYHKKRALS